MRITKNNILRVTVRTFINLPYGYYVLLKDRSGYNFAKYKTITGKDGRPHKVTAVEYYPADELPKSIQAFLQEATDNTQIYEDGNYRQYVATKYDED